MNWMLYKEGGVEENQEYDAEGKRKEIIEGLECQAKDPKFFYQQK